MSFIDKVLNRLKITREEGFAQPSTPDRVISYPLKDFEDVDGTNKNRDECSGVHHSESAVKHHLTKHNYAKVKASAQILEFKPRG